jgi:eukaryotic-like serine/threonine-protein kinase
MSQDGERLTAPTAAVTVPHGHGPPPGTVLFGRYRVESLLGLGGTGVVVKAVELDTDEHVAIKLLRDDVEIDQVTRLRLAREAKAAVQLRSPHAARVRDVGTHDEQPFMVMELLEGMDLGRLLAANQRLDRAFAVELAFQACDALAEAHAIGIIHRDVKPSNLFVTWLSDGTIRTKVLDFGISKTAQAPDLIITSRAGVLGTPAYMSPEQLRSASNVDVRTDVWSLGTVLYEMIEGRPPFEAGNFPDMCVVVATEDPAPMTQLRDQPELEAVIRRCLAKRPDDRFASVVELAHALVPFVRDPATARARVPASEAQRAPPSGPQQVPPSGPYAPQMAPPSGPQQVPPSGPHAAQMVPPSGPQPVPYSGPYAPQTSGPYPMQQHAPSPMALPPRRSRTTLTIVIAIVVTLAIGIAIMFATGALD